MNKSFYIFTFLLLALCILGCEKDNNLEPTPNPTIDFELEQTNSSNDYSTKVEKILNVTKSSRWEYGPDSVLLISEINFDLLLLNSDTVNFGFWFMKYDKRNLINLYGDTLTFGGEDWDYKEFENEANNFYNNFFEARVLINNNVIFHQKTNNDFKILKIDEILIDSENKSYLEISFNGTAYGWYDPTGEYQEVYKFSKGIFKGTIE